MTKAEFLKLHRDVHWCDSDSDVYDWAYIAQHVTDDEELVELAKTCVVSTDDFQFYLEELLHDAS